MKKIIPFVKEIEFKTMISKITSISLEHTLRVKEDNLISGHFILEGTYKMTQASQIDEDFSYKIPVDIEIDEKYDTSNVTLDIDDFTYEVIDEERIKLNISLCIDNIEEKEEPVLIGEELHESFYTNEDDTKETTDIKTEERNDRSIEALDDLFLDTSKKEELIINDETEEKQKEIQESCDTYNSQIDNVLSKQQETKRNDIFESYNSFVNDYPNNQENQIQQSINANNINQVESLFSSFKDTVETFKTYCVYIVKEEDTIDSILKKYNITKEELEEYNNLEDIRNGSKVVIPSSKNE